MSWLPRTFDGDGRVTSARQFRLRLANSPMFLHGYCNDDGSAQLWTVGLGSDPDENVTLCDLRPDDAHDLGQALQHLGRTVG